MEQKQVCPHGWHNSFAILSARQGTEIYGDVKNYMTATAIWVIMVRKRETLWSVQAVSERMRSLAVGQEWFEESTSQRCVEYMFISQKYICQKEIPENYLRNHFRDEDFGRTQKERKKCGNSNRRWEGWVGRLSKHKWMYSSRYLVC